MTVIDFINQAPKCELHVHIEGTFEPELMFRIAKRNNIPLSFKSVEEVRAAYNFNNLKEFLNIYYKACEVLKNEQDFYDLTTAYMKKCAEQNIVHTEIMFDPQTHLNNGVAFGAVINGIHNALKHAEAAYGITSRLIMSFLRDKPEISAIETWGKAMPYMDKFHAVGLDSYEVGNPPENFERVFAMAAMFKKERVAHASEEGPAEYTRNALDRLCVSRIDHGNNALNDHTLVRELIQRQVPLTVCPLSNIKLCVVDDLKNHPLKKMIELGLCATINSDDPAYFGGYLTDNFTQTTQALDLSLSAIHTLISNSFRACFLDNNSKMMHIKELYNLYEVAKS